MLRQMYKKNNKEAENCNYKVEQAYIYKDIKRHIVPYKYAYTVHCEDFLIDSNTLAWSVFNYGIHR